MRTIKEQIAIDLKTAREYLSRCVESLTDAQQRVERLERLEREWSNEKETLAADLIAAGVVEEARPF